MPNLRKKKSRISTITLKTRKVERQPHVLVISADPPPPKKVACRASYNASPEKKRAASRASYRADPEEKREADKQITPQKMAETSNRKNISRNVHQCRDGKL